METRPKISCALIKRADYGPRLAGDVEKLVRAAELPFTRGCKVLVKPNLLTGVPLACTHPAIVAAVCEILLERGCKVEVADSPGFGSVKGVAKIIGLEKALAPLGLKILPMDRPVPLQLKSANVRGLAVFKVSRRALECDYMFSLPKIKAHAQMRLTLAVKNCFGCVCGFRKALIHAKEGKRPELFAACLAALWASLPPVCALADGIVAMHQTGPVKGAPYPLGLLGACGAAEALDTAIMRILSVPDVLCPLAEAIAKQKNRRINFAEMEFPFLSPKDFDVRDFRVPASLAPTSFSPGRLCKSLLRRSYAALKSLRQQDNS